MTTDKQVVDSLTTQGKTISQEEAPPQTLTQMHDASVREAEGILRNKLGPEFRVTGQVEFSHAIIKGSGK